MALDEDIFDALNSYTGDPHIKEPVITRESALNLINGHFFSYLHYLATIKGLIENTQVRICQKLIWRKDKNALAIVELWIAKLVSHSEIVESIKLLNIKEINLDLQKAKQEGKRGEKLAKILEKHKALFDDKRFSHIYTVHPMLII